MLFQGSVQTRLAADFSLLFVFRCVSMKEACLLFASRSLIRVAHVQRESLGEHLRANIQIPLKAAVRFGGIKGCGQKPPCLGVCCKVKSKEERGGEEKSHKMFSNIQVAATNVQCRLETSAL